MVVIKLKVKLIILKESMMLMMMLMMKLTMLLILLMKINHIINQKIKYFMLTQKELIK
jgi:hypothetical protein